MKLKYVLGITFTVPLSGLILVNIFAANLSSFQVSTTTFVCLAVIILVAIDVLFMTFKRYKSKIER